MNKKLFLMTSLVAIALATSSMYSSAYASNDDMEDDDDESTHDMNDDNSSDSDDDSDDDINDDKGGRRKEMRKEFKDDMKEGKEIIKDKRHELHRALFAQLDKATQDAIKALHASYKTQFEAIKNDTTKTVAEKQTAVKTLHDEVRAKVRALIPTDLQDEFDALKVEIDDLRDMWEVKKDELKAEWKNTKEDRKAKKEERRNKMKGKVRVVFGKLDNVLAKFEANKTSEELVTKYTTIMTKLNEKIATIDTSSDLYTLLKGFSEDLADRIAQLQAK